MIFLDFHNIRLTSAIENSSTDNTGDFLERDLTNVGRRGKLVLEILPIRVESHPTYALEKIPVDTFDCFPFLSYTKTIQKKITVQRSSNSMINLKITSTKLYLNLRRHLCVTAFDLFDVEYFD
ncbi:hypothetical protein T12_6817 [Trichinella patagoniensis]|uniref:Uncharacterized protein n=1 Tax=Trichinella patagoniensis TaxID=990121 RepID=A0A0V1A5L3_9BILA|nr:hypothetical protein T12_6817 [Trichinella patagoniensis]